MNHLPVLIVGAGPTGLMLACELERRDIPFRIIDKNAEPTQGSNATWIQSRTLEIFDAIGIVDDFLKLGHQCKAINLYENGNALANIPLTFMDTPYPYILMLPQRETERLLTKKLEQSKIRVERSFELINIKQTDRGVVSTIKLPDGGTEDITSDYVVACDGVNSTVREKLNIPFVGKDIPEQFMVADARMSSFLPANEIHVFFDRGTVFPDKGTIFSAFPWGAKEYRLSANLYLSDPRKFFTEQEVKEIVAERTYGNYIVEDVSWISPYWMHSKSVSNMQYDSIFLVGDAAHTHAPISGQGMNTGLQDAYNLAWKLSLVIQGKAKTSLLDSYQLERFPVVNKVVDESEHLTQMALFDKSFFTKLRKFSKSVAQEKNVKKVTMELTQLNIRYENSPIIDNLKKTPPKSPRQGERAPDVTVEHVKNLYSYLRNTVHNILLFAGNAPTKNDVLKINSLQKTLNEKLAGLVKVFVVTVNNQNDFDNIISDTTGAIHKRYNVKKFAAYIVRPDTYIAYYSNEMDSMPIEKFLQQYLLVNA